MREKAEAAKFKIYRLDGANGGKHVLQWAQFRGFCFPKKFQRDVQILGANPLHLRSNGAEFFQERSKGGSDGLLNFDGNEKTHEGNLLQLAGLTRRGCGLPSKR